MLRGGEMLQHLKLSAFKFKNNKLDDFVNQKFQTFHITKLIFSDFSPQIIVEFSENWKLYKDRRMEISFLQAKD